MIAQKESEFALSTEGKESIQDRLKVLMNGRSLRKVAADWGFPYSTLNNYFAKGTMPGVDVLIAVSEVEQVSIEWLITGRTATPAPQPTQRPDVDVLRTAWLSAFEFMNKVEAEALLRIMLSGGARGIIKLAEHEATLDESLMLLPVEMKERLLGVSEAHGKSKKGASEGSEVTEQRGPDNEHKRAG